jgi:hypothetical protein
LEERLEDWIEDDISMLSDDLLIIGRQIETDYDGKIDLLCIDRVGDLAIVELKRDRTPREITAQILDYASWIKDLSIERIINIANSYLKSIDQQSLEYAFNQKFDTDLPEVLNDSHSMLIVASEIDTSSERIINYLSTTYDVDINAVTFQYFKDDGGEYIARMFLIEPTQTEVLKKSRRRIIPPKGTFDISELKQRLEETVNHPTKLRPKFICFLKFLLSEERIFGREEIKRELQKEGISKNERQAGTHLSNISAFILNPSNSHLQQIIDFEQIGWGMKDNYRIVSEYRELVASVISDLKNNE